MSEGNKGFPYFKQVAIGALSGVATLAVIIGGFSISGAASYSPGTAQPQATSTSTQGATPTPTATDGRTCSVNDKASDPRLASFSGVVINAATDEVLFDRNANKPAATASVMKVLTAAAALQTLGPNYRVDTRVYSDPAQPGTVILVGGGDPTLSRTAPGQQSVYKDAPKLSTLAVSVNAAMKGTPITKIVVDSSLFAGPSWEPTWERSEQTIGYMSEVTALQVDGDRANPQAATSPRSTKPVMNAGTYFKKALGAGASGATIVEGRAPATAVEIAKVSSQPISKWIKHMLLVSDNTEAEALARLVSLDSGFDGSFGSINAAIKRALSGTGIDASGVVIKDGSGLSDFNAVSPTYVAKLMKLVLTGYGDYNVILQGLPVAAESGSLADRFKGDNIDAAGKVIAKSGWIKRGYTLAGIIKSGDGTNLVFAVYALGNVKDDAKQAIDDLVTAVYRCGNTLSNQ